MKKYILSIFLFLILATPALAANTTGYAWSESLGWFDFSNATVSDTAVTGYAYNDNTGWLVLDGITNDGGYLSGYAWSESVGYFDFSNVTLDKDGEFHGHAYNDNTGFLILDAGTVFLLGLENDPDYEYIGPDFGADTEWAPAVAPEPRRKNGGSKRKVTLTAPTTSPSVNTPTTVPTSSPVPTVLKDALASNPRDLELNTQGEDVKLLQQFLNQQGFIINTPGQVGSAGYETSFFGNLTKQALIKFQIKHNITPSAGYFGPKTRAFIKTLQN